MILVRSGRETSSVYVQCRSPADQAVVPYRIVHFLSSICSECIQSWSSCPPFHVTHCNICSSHIITDNKCLLSYLLFITCLRWSNCRRWEHINAYSLSLKCHFQLLGWFEIRRGKVWSDLERGERKKRAELSSFFSTPTVRSTGIGFPLSSLPFTGIRIFG